MRIFAGISLRDTRMPRSALVQFGFKNIGDMNAYRSVFNIIVPADADIWKVDTIAGDGERRLPIHVTAEDHDGSGRDARWIAYEIDLPKTIPPITCVRIASLTPGVSSIPVRITVDHPDADEVSETFDLPLSS